MKISVKILKWTVIFTVTILFVCEVSFRLYYKKMLERWESHLYQPDSVLGYRYQPNMKWSFSNIAYSNTCDANSLGFPGKEFTKKKSAGTYRIIVVGNSDDTGFNTNGPLGYSLLLDQYFKKDGLQVEVLNCAVDGRDRGVRNIELIKKELIGYEPDLILMRRAFPLKDRFRFRTTYRGAQINYLYWNEALPAQRFIDDMYREKPRCLSLYDWSYSFRYTVKYYLDRRSDKDPTLACQIIDKLIGDNVNILRAYVRNEVYWEWEAKSEKERGVKEYSVEESLATISSLSSALAKGSIRLVLFDTYWDTQAEDLINLFAEHQINYVPLNVPFKDDYNFKEHDGHSTQEGHKAIADEFYIYLREFLRDDLNARVIPTRRKI
jgi:hypothetical protein